MTCPCVGSHQLTVAPESHLLQPREEVINSPLPTSHFTAPQSLYTKPKDGVRSGAGHGGAVFVLRHFVLYSRGEE